MPLNPVTPNIAQNSLVVNVKGFGAIGNSFNGTLGHDDTKAIQTAIDSLPATGGTVFFPPGEYGITSTLTVGDGTGDGNLGTHISTKGGVLLVGAGNPMSTRFATGSVPLHTPIIWWCGASDGTMVSIRGPLEGWGLQYLSLEGDGSAAGSAGIGLEVISGQYGDTHDISVQECRRCIY